MRDLHQEITNKIVEEIERGALPWLKPWTGASGPAHSVPVNATSGKRYSGVNVLMAWAHCAATGTRARMITYKQAADAGGHVRKGEHGATVIKVGTYTKSVTNPVGDTVEEDRTFLKAFTVFSVDQCDGLPADIMGEAVKSAAVQEHERNERVDAFAAATGATILHNGGDRAYYSVSLDHIQLPEKAQFASANQYYATLCHEMVHWSGHASRLARTFGKRFGDNAYAAEELVAEMGAAFACAELGIVGELRHAGYIDNWLRALKSDKRILMASASAASKAADYLLAFRAGAESRAASLAA